VELYRLNCVVPEGNHKIHVQLDTICNAPAVDASGHLSFGNGSVGILNWPTCLLYPEGPTARETRVHLTLRLPDRWKYRKVPSTCEDNWGWSPQGVIDMHRPESGASCSSRPRPQAASRFIPIPPARSVFA
jgi:hypothetical protein